MTHLIRRNGATPLPPSLAPRLPEGGWAAVAFGFIAWGIFPERERGGTPAPRSLPSAGAPAESAGEAKGEAASSRHPLPRPRAGGPPKGLFVNTRA